MIVFPNCKINFGLHIINKRLDGFHNLATIFYPVAIKDALEIIPSSQTDGVIFSSSGLQIDGDSQNNLCVKAYHLLKKDFLQLPGVAMHLHKNIAMGAGLGGGSADAAFTLQLLNDQFGLQISTPQLLAYALQLGSDCPFFIINQPCYATGRGEALEPIELSLSGYQLVIIHPHIHVNTSAAFAALQMGNKISTAVDLKAIVQQPIAQWRTALVNDFEQPIFAQHPILATIKEQLYAAGALYAAMSGSGSTVFGIFKKTAAPTLHFDPSYLVLTINL